MMYKSWMVLLALALLLSACRTTSPPPAPTSTEEVAQVSPTQTLTPTLAPTVTPTPTQTSTPEPTLPPQPLGPSGFPANTNPLTGLATNDPQLLDRRPVAIKLQLFPRGQRPVWGISQADIVYDYVQNFGMTRLFAIFYGNNPAKVGPIRSARLLDGTLVQTYQTVYAFGSADARILYNLNTAFGVSDRLVYEGAQACPALCREDPNGYNFLFANLTAFNQYLADRGVPNERPTLDGMLFQFDAPTGGKPADEVRIRYSISAYVGWEWDTQSGRYLRSQDNIEAQTRELEEYVPFLDGTTDEQVGADNVFVLFVPHATAFSTVPGTSEVLDIQLTGTGKAIAFRDGQAYSDLLWNRQAGSLLYLTSSDGQPFPFKHGSTWFQVVGAFANVENPGESSWRIEHR